LVCNKATIPRHMHWHTGPGTLKRLTALAKASILLAAVIRERQKVLCLFSMNKIKNSYACCLKTDTCFWFSWSVKWLQIPAMDLKVTTLSSLSATTVVHLSFLIKSLSLSLSLYQSIFILICLGLFYWLVLYLTIINMVGVLTEKASSGDYLLRYQRCFWWMVSSYLKPLLV
jgi:hypothetical protein